MVPIIHPREDMEAANLRKGIFYMLLSAAGLSFFSLFIKLEADSVSFFFLTFLRFLVPLLLIIPYVFWKEGIPRFSHLGAFRLQLGRVGCLLVSQYGIFYYLTQASLLDATVLQSTSPLFIPILERIFMGHTIRKKAIIGMIISFIGVLFVLRPDKGILGWESYIGLCAALGQAGSQVLFGMQSRSTTNEGNVFYLFFFSTIASLLIFLLIAPFTGGILVELGSIARVDNRFYWSLLGVGFASLANQAFRGVAYRHARPGTLAPTLYFSVVVSGFLDWGIFHNLPDGWTILGAILVVLGGILPFLRKKIQEIH
ncbi:MAG: DMT family transporter [Chlamydiales bacterium]|nr:DMT family transporter [Chlamydiales bacterium]